MCLLVVHSDIELQRSSYTECPMVFITLAPVLVVHLSDP